VLRDFVELPSQLMEHWLLQPEVLSAHAKHWESGENIPEELVAKIRAARVCGKGFGTVEYLSCALVDQAIHVLEAKDLEGLDLATYEAQTMQSLGMPKEIILRHRLPHFQHLFSSSSYAAAYYVYLWAEVLDADAFDAFLQSPGGCFDRETADRLRSCIYSTGGSIEPGKMYRNFRGRDPSVIPMLRKKLGLTAEEAEIASAGQ
jgi:peptidyl-dipeptidase Dcp